MVHAQQKNLCLKTLPKNTPLSPAVNITYIGPPRNALFSIVAQSPYYVVNTFAGVSHHFKAIIREAPRRNLQLLSSTYHEQSTPGMSEAIPGLKCHTYTIPNKIRIKHMVAHSSQTFTNAWTGIPVLLRYM